MWHGLKGFTRSWHRLLRSSWQRNTDVLSSLHKLIGIGEVKLLSAAAGRVPWAFRWLFTEIHEQIFCSLQVTTRWHWWCTESIKHWTKWQLFRCCCMSNVTLAALYCRCSMCQPQRLVLQTNDRCRAVPMCSPLALCLSVASPIIHNISDLEKLSSWVCTVCS